MTILSKIEATLPHEPFARARADVNEWRGRCLHLFAEAEFEASQCLETLSRIEGRGANIRRRHLIGQRYEDLSSALEAGGPFEHEGKKASRSLRELRGLDEMRAMLCHGSSAVTLDQSGNWTAIFKSLTFRSGVAKVDVRVVVKGEADVMLQDLQKKSNRLCSLLESLRTSLSKTHKE